MVLGFDNKLKCFIILASVQSIFVICILNFQMKEILFLLLIYFIKWLIKWARESNVSDIEQNTNRLTDINRIKYISNGIELKTSLKKYYFDILDLQNGKSYDRSMIFEQVDKRHSFNSEDIKLGYKTKFNASEIILAKMYVMDYHDYIVHLN